MMAYHSFKDASGNLYGSFKTFRITRGNRSSWGDGSGFWENEWGERSRILCGFYWQSCFPGCLPDGEPMGPFRSEAAAIRDAQEMD